MKRIWKKAVLLFVTGFVLGLLIAACFALADRVPLAFMGFRDRWAIVVYFLYCGLMGAVNMGTMVLYDIERWGLTRTTVTHLLIVMTMMFILFFSLGMPRNAFLIMMVAAVAAYFLIWLGLYLSYRREVRKMNDDLKNRRSGPRRD